MSKSIMPGVIAMAATVVASNILVQYLLGSWLTWGALTYPVAFLITDLVNRLQGQKAARRVVVTGFFVGLICSLIGSQIHGEFGPLVTLRVAIASGCAYLCSQLTDIAVFDRLRALAWWKAPLVSTLISSTIDTVIFFTIAFSAGLSWIDPSTDVSWANEAVPLLGFGPVLPLWISLAIADWSVKMGLGAVALVPFRAVVKKLTQSPL